jgi:hypothetical protein
VVNIARNRHISVNKFAGKRRTAGIRLLARQLGLGFFVQHSATLCGIFAHSKNCRAREAAIATQQLRKHSTIPQQSLNNLRAQQWRNCWKRRFLCGP